MGELDVLPPGSPAVGLPELTGTSHVVLWGACVLFAGQSALHWFMAACRTSSARAQQHELLSGAATGLCALSYQAMASGVSRMVYEVTAFDGQHQRICFSLLYAERAVAGALVFVNIAALARERRPPMAALVAVWFAETAALFFGNLVEGWSRFRFLIAAGVLLVPQAGMLLAAMGRRLHLSQLHAVYRFLSTWCSFCSACYCLVYFFSEVVVLFNTETEIIAYALLDGCAIGISSLVVTCAGPEVQVGLLPAQEAELSLYPGPHRHGFYPNPDYYDDNL
mmetsp:Transcript_178844/g.573150  ORF Transcript_178844/g.573150 Transcript_178844/m.573150 type:complete len:280 (-) Transcript_178844:291-1130(-)